MQCLKRKWTKASPILSVLTVLAVQPRECQPEELTEKEVDSFCQLYTQVIKKPGDEKITARLEVKKALLVNEKLYRKVCPQEPAA